MNTNKIIRGQNDICIRKYTLFVQSLKKEQYRKNIVSDLLYIGHSICSICNQKKSSMLKTTPFHHLNQLFRQRYHVVVLAVVAANIS